jgi:hypothetical protein
VIAMPTGPSPTLMGVPAVSVAVRIGVTVFEPLLVTWSVTISNGTVQYARGPGLRRGDIVLMHFTKRTLAELDLFLRTARRARLQPALLESYIG